MRELPSDWTGRVGLDPRLWGTHSLRRTKATLIYRRTGNLRAVQPLLDWPKFLIWASRGGGKPRWRPCSWHQRASFARLDHPGLRLRTMRSLSSGRAKAGPVGIASARPTLPTSGRNRKLTSRFKSRTPQKHASISSYAIALAFAATTRGSWRVSPHDAALCNPNARASRASTGATVSIRRAAAWSTESPAVSTTAAARA
jgi:hypothetical protein